MYVYTFNVIKLGLGFFNALLWFGLGKENKFNSKHTSHTQVTRNSHATHAQLAHNTRTTRTQLAHNTHTTRPQLTHKSHTTRPQVNQKSKIENQKNPKNLKPKKIEIK